MPVQVNRATSLELLHVYSDEPPARETDGVHLGTSVTSRLTESVLITCLLVDNYNASSSTTQNWWPERQSSITYDFWCLEANLVAYRDDLYDLLGDSRARRREVRFAARTGRHSCSFLTCAWYLVRLGVLEPEAAFINSFGDGFAPCTTLINVLPRETAATEVIAHSLLQIAVGDDAFCVVNHYY